MISQNGKENKIRNSCTGEINESENPCARFVQDWYDHFIKLLIMVHPDWLYEMINEERRDVRFILYGTYYRWLYIGEDQSQKVHLQVQRIRVLDSEGHTLYTKALLPGLIIPYQQHSLQFILQCLLLYYSRHSTSWICREMDIDERTLRKWVSMSKEASEETIRAWTRLPDFASAQFSQLVFTVFSQSAYAEGLKNLYVQLKQCGVWNCIFADSSFYH